MATNSSAYGGPSLDAIERLAREAVARFLGDRRSVDLRLVSVSENYTFEVAAGGGRARMIARVYRKGYHSDAAIRSEHSWMRALREQSPVRTPAVLAGADGDTLLTIATPEIPDGRRVSFFEYLSGSEPHENDLAGSFHRLGRITAQLHQHAREWTPPSRFTRHRWTVATMLTDARPTWGRWQDHPDVRVRERSILSRAERLLIDRLGQFGNGANRFGLIHADLRLPNLLIHDGSTQVIDFDDCGYSWFLYDLGASLTFIEDHPDIDRMVFSWINGYQDIRWLESDELNELDTFRLLRRLVVTSWLSTHMETEAARMFGTGYVARAALAAQSYLKKYD